METARHINTFETSILPYEDCCTIFTPPHPKIRPELAEILEAEAAMPGLAALEAEGEQVLRAPLSEALWFLWKDNLDENKPSAGWLDQMQRQMQTLGNELGAHSAFAEDAETLFLIADSALPNFSGGNGRYRYAKAVELSGRTNAVLTLAPRYENTAMILDMRGLHDACSAPLFQISLDNDWDETAWSRLRSFLYYC